MKWFCILPLLFIIYTEIPMWALARLHPRDHRQLLYRISLNFDQGVMEDFDTRNALGRRRLSIIENHNNEVEDASDFNFEESIKSDYGVSDPPPLPKRPSKKPVQYRIFSRPPSTHP